MWFKNLKVYRLSSTWSMRADQLASALEEHTFQSASASEMQSIGWVAPREDSDLVYALNGQLLLTLRSEKKLLPSGVINEAVKLKAHEIEVQQGYRPGRKQTREIKEAVIDELLPKAFSTHHTTRVWIDTRNLWLAIDAASPSKCDEVLSMLAKSLDPFPVSPLYVVQSPAAAMTNWLISDDAPAGFTIDQDTELKSTGESRAAVRYVRQSLDADDMRKHVQAGKQCTRLALTWSDRVSFVLTDDLDIKRLDPLDVLKEGQDDVSRNDAERFDSDFTLMTSELARLLSDLVDALGGEKQE